MKDLNREAGKASEPVYSLSSEYTLTTEELTDFDEKQWLSDNVIDFYLKMIAIRSQNPSLNLRRVYAHRSTFYSLLSHKHSRASAVSDVWATNTVKNVMKNGRLKMRLCCLVDNRAKIVTVYNPLPVSTTDRNVEQIMMEHLKNEHLKWNPKQSFSQYTIGRLGRTLIPHKQDNLYDCGVYILAYAESLSRDSEFDITPDNAGYFREKMKKECMNLKLDASS